MIESLCPGDRERLADLVKLVVGAAAPEIIKCVAASRDGVRVEAIGDLLSVEPAPLRDYRKELWIASYLATRQFAIATDAVVVANESIDNFDAKFGGSA